MNNVSCPIAARQKFLEEMIYAVNKIMDEKGMSRAEMGRSLGVSREYATKLLKGNLNCRVGTIIDMFTALDVTVTLTIGGESDWVPGLRYESRRLDRRVRRTGA